MPSSCVFLLVVAFFLFAWGPSFAQDPGKKTATSGPVTIEGKDEGGIVVAGQRYRVEKLTVILDATGNAISLCDLPLPCEAKVEYRLTENHEPLCLRIEIVRVLKAPPDFVIADDPG
jgi:hypothetical protein